MATQFLLLFLVVTSYVWVAKCDHLSNHGFESVVSTEGICKNCDGEVELLHADVTGCNHHHQEDFCPFHAGQNINVSVTLKLLTDSYQTPYCTYRFERLNDTGSVKEGSWKPCQPTPNLCKSKAGKKCTKGSNVTFTFNWNTTEFKNVKKAKGHAKWKIQTKDPKKTDKDESRSTDFPEAFGIRIPFEMSDANRTDSHSDDEANEQSIKDTNRIADPLDTAATAQPPALVHEKIEDDEVDLVDRESAVVEETPKPKEKKKHCHKKKHRNKEVEDDKKDGEKTDSGTTSCLSAGIHMIISGAMTFIWAWTWNNK